jgi:RNA polymerase sigma factor (sigma-70 family)
MINIDQTRTESGHSVRSGAALHSAPTVMAHYDLNGSATVPSSSTPVHENHSIDGMNRVALRKSMTKPSDVSEISPLQEIHPEDAALLAQVGLGDKRALASLYDRHSTLVYSVALRVCRDAASAEEVLQNIFMQMWLAPEPFASEPGSLDGRLGLLSRNLAIDLMRRRKSSESSEKPPLNRHFNPISHTEVSRLMQKPHALVLLLPDADRQVLEMAFFAGKKSVEIAEETGLPVDTIASRVVRALSVLRDGAAAPDPAEDTGLEVLDLDTNPEFTARNLHTRDVRMQMEGLRRLTHSFVENPDTILQELVNAAVDLCGADSAGISLETEEKSDANYYHWVATAGQYNGFLNAVLPRYPSACGICLERGKPQLFRVRQRFFDIMGIEAPLVTDGILLPWQVEETRGTIFIMAHGRTAAFDKDDGQMMRVLADFAAMAVRHQRQQRALLQQVKATAAAEMANKLAHKINNPLQSLMQVAYLAAEGGSGHSTEALGQKISADLRRLAALVTESLARPAAGSN